MSQQPAYKTQDDERGESLSDYWPLVSLIGIAALAGLAINAGVDGGFMEWMHYFMGFFLCAFAMLKIFNLPGFVDGFFMYDLITRQARNYGYVYPFIELGLGLGYLSFFAPLFIYSATILILGIGAVGVLLALRRGLNIKCPCMGSVLNVPLSTVTLTEDLGMVTMASVMLVMTLIA